MIRARKLFRIQRNSRPRIVEDNQAFNPQFLAGSGNFFGEWPRLGAVRLTFATQHPRARHNSVTAEAGQESQRHDGHCGF